MRNKINNYIFKIIPKRIALRFIQLCSFGFLIGVLRGKSVKVYYYQKHSNFGDMLNVDLFNYLNIKHVWVPFTFARLVAIGSVLDMHISIDEKDKNSKKLYVLGSGFIKPPKSNTEVFRPEVEIVALRGTVSRDRCARILNKNLDNVVLGDPGLLIRRIFPDLMNNLKKKYEVGIVCHHVDKNMPSIGNIKLDYKSYKFIDIQQPTESFIKEMSECKFILSSAMHGLISADSLGIPNRHIILSDKLMGGNYKFLDYYSVYKDFDYKPIRLSEQKIVDEDIDQFIREYTISSESVDLICDNLEKRLRGVVRLLNE